MQYKAKKIDLSIRDIGLSLNDVFKQGLDWIACEGARLILTIALQEEITAFLERGYYERNDKVGYRNGYRARCVQCGSGEIDLSVPKVTGADRSFRSHVLHAWRRKSEALLEVIPALYVEGLSTRDFRRALKPLWGESGLSRSTISRANQVLKESFEAWRKRDLSQEDIQYLFLDGYYLGVRRGTKEKEGLLIAHGISRNGRRVLLALAYGGRESTESWRAVLHDLIERGLKVPALVISDGNPGLLRALSDIWPDVPHNGCAVHKVRNVLARVPRKRRDEVKSHLAKIFHAAGLEDALLAARNFSQRYQKELPTAVSILARNLADYLTFYRYPEVHWKRIRTTNVLERVLREVRRRTDVIGRFPDEKSALALVFGVIEQERLKWHGIKMNQELNDRIASISNELRKKPLVIEWADQLAAIA